MPRAHRVRRQYGKGREQRLNVYGVGANPWHAYKVQEYVASLQFVYHGKTAWETTASSIPGILHLVKMILSKASCGIARSRHTNYSGACNCPAC